MVGASRRHLTDRYAVGVDRLLWETEKRLIPDLDAIRSVIAAAKTRQAEALDVGAALVLLQAARLELDRLEFETIAAAHEMGMHDEAIAAVLELPDAAAAVARFRALEARRALPYEEAQRPRPVAPPHSEASERAARRASRAAGRAAEAARRREQLSQVREQRKRETRPAYAERAAAHADEARVLADEAAERAALGLMRAAEALDRCAAEYTDFAAAGDGTQFTQKAEECHRLAARYRGLAAEYRAPGSRPGPGWAPAGPGRS
jgi:type IV secretory pathway VirB10-like protein